MTARRNCLSISGSTFALLVSIFLIPTVVSAQGPAEPGVNSKSSSIIDPTLIFPCKAYSPRVGFEDGAYQDPKTKSVNVCPKGHEPDDQTKGTCHCVFFVVTRYEMAASTPVAASKPIPAAHPGASDTLKVKSTLPADTARLRAPVKAAGIPPNQTGATSRVFTDDDDYFTTDQERAAALARKAKLQGTASAPAEKSQSSVSVTVTHAPRLSKTLFVFEQRDYVYQPALGREAYKIVGTNNYYVCATKLVPDAVDPALRKCEGDEMIKYTVNSTYNFPCAGYVNQPIFHDQPAYHDPETHDYYACSGPTATPGSKTQCQCAMGSVSRFHIKDDGHAEVVAMPVVKPAVTPVKAALADSTAATAAATGIGAIRKKTATPAAGEPAGAGKTTPPPPALAKKKIHAADKSHAGHVAAHPKMKKGAQAQKPDAAAPQKIKIPDLATCRPTLSGAPMDPETLEALCKDLKTATLVDPPVAPAAPAATAVTEVTPTLPAAVSAPFNAFAFPTPTPSIRVPSMKEGIDTYFKQRKPADTSVDTTAAPASAAPAAPAPIAPAPVAPAAQSEDSYDPGLQY